MRSLTMKPNSAGRRGPSASLLVACTALLVLAGCQQKAEVAATSDEFEWARAALQRNPGIEVLAADAQSEVFTIKVKRTGATQAIKLRELAAAPISEVVATALASQPAIAAAASQPAATQAAAPPSDPAPAPPAVQTATATLANEPAAGAEKNYTIQRSAGQVTVSGPGISIVSAGPRGTSAVTQREQGERTVDPVICEGKRMLHFDNRNIYVDGNAIVARGGCELFITNSRVVSSGTAVVASDSIVHIVNSNIEGTQASFDAGDGAKMYLRSSTFQGLPRRAERAVVQDQGGNTWK